MIKKVILFSLVGLPLFLLGVELTASLLTANGPSEVSTGNAVVLNALVEKNRILRKKIADLAPKGIYIVIDTARNRLSLKEGNRVLLQAVISTGSGSILRDAEGGRQWVFDTPRGEFEVKTKVTGPKWIKPDWAFIEEGEKIPKDWKQRVEEGVLGDYALGFGNGYFIHGTLYKRLLGRNVTHGCIRVGDEELSTLYKLARIGTKIYIF